MGAKGKREEVEEMEDGVAAEIEVEEEDAEESVPELFKGPTLEDPWQRWPAGGEPIQEVPVRSVDGDAQALGAVLASDRTLLAGR